MCAEKSIFSSHGYNRSIRLVRVSLRPVRSCVTLFRYAAPEQELFPKILDKFFRGMEDDKTMEIPERQHDNIE